MISIILSSNINFDLIHNLSTWRLLSFCKYISMRQERSNEEITQCRLHPIEALSIRHMHIDPRPLLWLHSIDITIWHVLLTLGYQRWHCKTSTQISARFLSLASAIAPTRLTKIQYSMHDPKISVLLSIPPIHGEYEETRLCRTRRDSLRWESHPRDDPPSQQNYDRHNTETYHVSHHREPLLIQTAPNPWPSKAPT